MKHVCEKTILLVLRRNQSDPYRRLAGHTPEALPDTLFTKGCLNGLVVQCSVGPGNSAAHLFKVKESRFRERLSDSRLPGPNGRLHTIEEGTERGAHGGCLRVPE